jgi:hypothetical protein
MPTKQLVKKTTKKSVVTTPSVKVPTVKNTTTKKTNKYNLRTESWSYEKFAKLEPYVRNRDVEPRIPKVVKLLAKKYIPTHSIVIVGNVTKPFAKYKKGDKFRLDGNTRAEAFKIRPELIPEVPFHVIMMDVSSKEEADEIYYAIDSSDSVETSSHKITGYLREREYTALSKTIKEGKFKTALDNACRYGHNNDGLYLQTAPFEDKLDFFWNELIHIDKWKLGNMDNRSKTKMSANVLTSLLLVAKKYGVNHKRFDLLIENFKNELTVTNNSTEVDGVHYVNTTLFTKNALVWKNTGRTNAFTLIHSILYSFDKFILNENIKKGSKLPNEKKLTEFYQNYRSI